MEISITFFLLVLALISFGVSLFLPVRIKKYWLVFVSLGFCTWLSWEFSLILLGFTILNFYVGKKVFRSKSENWLKLIITIDLLFLLFLKYQKEFLNFDRIISFISLNIHEQTAITFVVPIGISFLVVQAIMMQVDIFHGRIKTEPDFWSTFLLLAYFPKIIAGPFERPATFLVQVNRPNELTNEKISSGFSLILIGLFRKLVIADPSGGLIPVDIFQNPQNYSGPLLTINMIAYAFFLYNDFAGYSYLVRGISHFLGIELTNNFSTPYLALNFSDFWNRWHASLSAFLREYIYFPISRKIAGSTGRFHGVFQIIIPPMLTMFVSGMWHGISWHMAVWGELHSLYLIGERVITLFRPKVIQHEQNWFFQWMSRIMVFVLVVLAWIPFRMTLEASISYYGQIFSFENNLRPIYLMLNRSLIMAQGLGQWATLYLGDPRVFIFLVLSSTLDLIQYSDANKLIASKWGKWPKAVLAALAIIVIILFSLAGYESPFVYQGF